MIAREIHYDADLIIAENPTRGVDVGAIEYIHNVLSEERGRGKAILLVSSELPELMKLCDRIAVMFDGRLVAEVERSDFNEATLGSYMVGKEDAA